jgi:FlaA1/EpsC-like NDP-sugar epimerase
MASKKTETSWLRKGVIHMAHWHFVLVAFLMGQIVLYDASKLITPDVVMKRWFFTSGLLVVSAVVWYLARSKVSSSNGFYRILTLGLILADIVVASFSVYTQRGMASRAVMLYANPLHCRLYRHRTSLFCTELQRRLQSRTLRRSRFLFTGISAHRRSRLDSHPHQT